MKRRFRILESDESRTEVASGLVAAEKVEFGYSLIVMLRRLSLLSLAKAISLYFLVVPSATISAQELIRVPQEMNLQQAIGSVSHGGTIEVSAGTYSAPTGGFRIENLSRSFTVKNVPGQVVVLSGNNSTDILRIRSNSKAVTVRGIVFADGYSSSDALGPAVTVADAEATFVGCTFRDNLGEPPSTSSGATHITRAEAYFVNSVWQDNVAKNSGAALALQQSSVWAHNSQFLRNRTNDPGHRDTAAGGAIHVGNSDLFISNSRFEGNVSGYAGGAVFGIGTYTNDPVNDPPATLMTVVNSTFERNRAERHPGVSYMCGGVQCPTEGGGFHAENQSLGRVYFSRFVENEADNGAGANAYRATLVIEDSVFLGNRAVGQLSNTGTGGAIGSLSNDANHSTTNYGLTNRPSVSLSVVGSLIRGQYGLTTSSANTAGGVFSAGDNNRAYGVGGVSAMGSPVSNRADLDIDQSLFYDILVDPVSGLNGKGAGFFVNLVNLDISNTLFLENEARGQGNWGQGGGGVVFGDSWARIRNTTFAFNKAKGIGGAIEAVGGDLDFPALSFSAMRSALG